MLTIKIVYHRRLDIDMPTIGSQTNVLLMEEALSELAVDSTLRCWNQKLGTDSYRGFLYLLLCPPDFWKKQNYFATCMMNLPSAWSV